MAKRIRTARQARLIRIGIRGARSEWALFHRDSDTPPGKFGDALWDRVRYIRHADKPLVQRAYDRTETKMRIGVRL